MASARSRLVRLLTLGMVDLDRRAADRLAWGRVFAVMPPQVPISSPSLAAAVEPYLWAALLVGGRTEVACDLGAGDPWPCHETTDYGLPDCPDVTTWCTIADRVRRSVEAASDTATISGPATATDDVSSLGAGIIAAWMAERVRHSVVAASDSVPCSGSATAIHDLTNFGGGIVAACAAHTAWMGYHCWLDGMNTGAIIRRDGGPWESHHCRGHCDDARCLTHDDIARCWDHGEAARLRASLPGWEQIDASDHSAVAEVSANLPDGVAHSSRWGELVAQAEARRPVAGIAGQAPAVGEGRAGRLAWPA